MKKFDPVDEYCREWVRWCETRNMYVAPGSTNILARLQPSKVGQAPNGRNSADMMFFDIAVKVLASMPRHAIAFPAFADYYMGHKQIIIRRDPIKRTAANLGIGQRTYYDHVKRFAAAAYRMSFDIKTAHLALSAMAEIAGAREQYQD